MAQFPRRFLEFFFALTTPHGFRSDSKENKQTKYFIVFLGLKDFGGFKLRQTRDVTICVCMLQSSKIQLLFVNSHFVTLRSQIPDLVAYINYAYVMYVKYFFNIFHTAPQAAIIYDNPV